MQGNYDLINICLRENVVRKGKKRQSDKNLPHFADWLGHNRTQSEAHERL